jgi:hypothetical protein
VEDNVALNDQGAEGVNLVGKHLDFFAAVVRKKRVAS